MPVSPKPSRPSNRDEVAAGLLIAAIGAGAAVIALTQYPLGTAARMGAGYMPTLLGIALAGLGLLVALQSARAEGGRRIDFRAAARPVGLILGSVVFFALVVGTLGLVVTGALTILGAAAGSRDASLRETAVLATGMALATSLIFVKLLGLPFKLWPLV